MHPVQLGTKVQAMPWQLEAQAVALLLLYPGKEVAIERQSSHLHSLLCDLIHSQVLIDDQLTLQMMHQQHIQNHTEPFNKLADS